MLGFLLLGGSLSGHVQAQVVVPTFGTRGEVPPDTVGQVMQQLRAAISRQTGLVVSAGDLVTPGIAGSLDPSFSYLIAEVEGLRYALSGQIQRVEGGSPQAPFSLSILIADAEAERASDIYTEPFGLSTLPEVAARLAERVARFVTPTGNLQAGSAELFLSSQPGEARVYLNGIDVGETSKLDVLMLQPGTYLIEVRKEGYLPETRSLSLRDGQIQLVNIVLTAVVGGSIQVMSRPSATVYLDGEEVGTTPLTVQASPGTRKLSLQRPGFETITLDVPVQNFRVNQVGKTLTPVFARMLVWDVLESGLLSIDGALRSGGFAANLTPGPHRISARRLGQTVSFSVVVPAQGVFEIDLDAQRLVPLGF
ncbi:hypothetical protein BH24DEI2_BH24DEI2_12360 [soil metagenome]